MMNSYTLADSYETRIKACSLNHGLGLPHNYISKSIAAVIALFASVAIYFGMKDPRFRTIDFDKECKRNLKLFNRMNGTTDIELEEMKEIVFSTITRQHLEKTLHSN